MSILPWGGGGLGPLTGNVAEGGDVSVDDMGPLDRLSADVREIESQDTLRQGCNESVESLEFSTTLKWTPVFTMYGGGGKLKKFY